MNTVGSGRLYAAIAVVSCVGVGWLASRALPRTGSLEGSTIYTLDR